MTPKAKAIAFRSSFFGNNKTWWFENECYAVFRVTNSVGFVETGLVKIGVKRP